MKKKYITNSVTVVKRFTFDWCTQASRGDTRLAAKHVNSRGLWNDLPRSQTSGAWRWPPTHIYCRN